MPSIRKRNRWVAVVLSLVFTPFLDMLYLGHPTIFHSGFNCSLRTSLP